MEPNEYVVGNMDNVGQVVTVKHIGISFDLLLPNVVNVHEQKIYKIGVAASIVF